MHQHVLALGPGELPDGLHQPATLTRAISGRPAVDVPRPEADRAVVSLTTAVQDRPDHLFAMPTPERLSLAVARAPGRTVPIALPHRRRVSTGIDPACNLPRNNRKE